ncbi:heparinase II/III family protein [Paenibacillus doosanensis]|uniref:heparinase II/III domain-containing protein n=1 Tax=Paenibacillus doosanensis TaxID=1229154 RepID=UPI00217FBED6|nr:heparinase II/III family protein [Paenibacillus doosanensis]MCS7460652.1 heparinase II/III family protein [Paenibacillus doosanensis]
MRIGEKLQQYRWAEEIAGQLERELAPLLGAEPVIPAEPGGWWHQYVCPEHHTELLFDPLEEDATEFLCPYGCALHGEPYRGAWLVMKHQSCARFALEAAALYAAGRGRRYADWSAGVLLRYAEQFPKYPVHPEAEGWMLKGRAFHQALTEAIWATTLLRACLLLTDEGYEFAEAEKLDLFFAMLEESMTQARKLLAEEQGKPESNYTAWLNAALACVYARNRDENKMRELVDGFAGLKHHLTIGVNPDQMEYEGTTYYHVFVLRAYFIAAEMAERFGIDLYAARGEQGQSFEGMLDVLADLANERGELPALHDGPYRRVPYAREIAETVEIGYARYGKAGCVPILREAYRYMYGSPQRAGLEALLYGQGSWEPDARSEDEAQAKQRGSRLLETSGFVIGRRPGGRLSFYADYGPHGGSHGHDDKLHLTIAGRDGWLAPELGMVPYGSGLRKDWYACAQSHNTVTVNNRSQAAHTGELVRYEDGESGTYVWLRSTEAYPGCRLERHLWLTDRWLLDWFVAELDSEATIDWWMHSPRLEPAYRRELWQPPANRLLDDGEGPYRFVRPLAEWTAGSGESVCSVEMSAAAGGEGAALSMLAPPGSRIMLAETPGPADNPARSMNGLLHRQHGTSASFVTAYSDSSRPAAFAGPEAAAAGTRAVELSWPGERWRARLDPAEGLRLDRI